MSAVISGVTQRRLATSVGLVVAWCALWGDVSWANVASGIALTAVLMLIGVSIGTSGGLRIVALSKFCGLVLADLALSTMSVARSILSAPERVDEAIVAVPCAAVTRSHFLLMICAVTVTPGTAIVDADPESGSLYLHLLHADEADQVVEHVQRLAALAEEALPTQPAARPAEVVR